MLGSGIAMWQICCRIVVSLSVGGVVQHVRSRCPCSGVWPLVSLSVFALVSCTATRRAAGDRRSRRWITGPQRRRHDEHRDHADHQRIPAVGDRLRFRSADPHPGKRAGQLRGRPVSRHFDGARRVAELLHRTRRHPGAERRADQLLQSARRTHQGDGVTYLSTSRLWNAVSLHAHHQSCRQYQRHLPLFVLQYQTANRQTDSCNYHMAICYDYLLDRGYM